jgi:F0F1-type ATP synthase assembly protein I
MSGYSELKEEFGECADYFVIGVMGTLAFFLITLTLLAIGAGIYIYFLFH